MRGKWKGVQIGCVAALCAVIHVLPTSAQPAAATRGVVRQPDPGDVLLEPSRVYIFVGKSGFGHEHAVAGKLRSGVVKFGATQDAGQLVFEMASFEADPDYARKFIGLEGTSDPETRGKVTANMLGPEVLDVAGFPTAEFRIASARPLGSQSQRGLPIYELTGDFTMHGVTRPLRLRTEVQQQNSSTRVTGSFALRQSDFGMKPFSKGFGMIGVADELRIYGDLHLANEKSVAPATPK
jgi:hypothetical protein